MRVTRSYFQRFALQQMQQTQKNIAKYQAQISTGKKLLNPSDDPSAVATTEKLDAAIQRMAQYKNNADAVRQRLSQQEDVFNNMTDTMQRLKELSIQANTDVLSDDDRRIIAAEVKQIQNQLLDYANTRLPNGEYMFSGSMGNTQPFILNDNKVSYAGDQSESWVQLSDSRKVRANDTGDVIFQRIRNGNGKFYTDLKSGNSGTGVIDGGVLTDPASFTRKSFEIQFTDANTFDIVDLSDGSETQTDLAYQPGEPISFNGLSVTIKGAPENGDAFVVAPSKNIDIFSIAGDFANALKLDRSNPANIAKAHQTFDSVINNIDNTLENIQARHSDLGARMGYIDTTEDETESVAFILNKTRSEIEDTDYAEAISNLDFQMNTLEAIRQTYAKMSQSSLFDYLR